MEESLSIWSFGWDIKRFPGSQGVWVMSTSGRLCYFQCWCSGDSNQKSEANRPVHLFSWCMRFKFRRQPNLCGLATGPTVSRQKPCFTLLGLKGSKTLNSGLGSGGVKVRRWGHPKCRAFIAFMGWSWAKHHGFYAWYIREEHLNYLLLKTSPYLMHC